MKRVLTLFFILSFFSCKESKEEIILTIEGRFNSYLINSKSLFSKRFIDNEGKFINESRKEFLSKLDFDLSSDFNIVEIYNMFSSESYYNAAIKKNSKVYYFENGFETKSKFEVIPFERFKKNSSFLYCLLYETENNIERLTGKKIGDATFHISIHIIKKVNNEIKNYSSQNLCFLNKDNKPQY